MFSGSSSYRKDGTGNIGVMVAVCRTDTGSRITPVKQLYILSIGAVSLIRSSCEIFFHGIPWTCGPPSGASQLSLWCGTSHKLELISLLLVSANLVLVGSLQVASLADTVVQGALLRVLQGFEFQHSEIIDSMRKSFTTTRHTWAL